MANRNFNMTFKCGCDLSIPIVEAELGTKWVVKPKAKVPVLLALVSMLEAHKIPFTHTEDKDSITFVINVSTKYTATAVEEPELEDKIHLN